MGIKALGYVVISTAQMDTWDRFLAEVVGAMRAGHAASGAALYRIDDRPFRFWIEPGVGEQLTAAAYEIEGEAEFSEIRARIAKAGRPVTLSTAEDARSRGVADYFRTSDPAGNGLEFFVGDARDAFMGATRDACVSATRELCVGATRDVGAFVSPAGVSGFVTGAMGMGHAVFGAPNFAETHAFYRDVIGFHDTDIPHFRFSDEADDPGMRFAFMHADNGRHHSVALGEMPVPPSGCVHLMLEMKTITDVGKCHDRMRQAGVLESATLGRHVNDQTFGFYMQTPGGFDIEIGCDPLVIDPATWTPTAHLAPSEWGHVWAWQEAMTAASQGEAA